MEHAVEDCIKKGVLRHFLSEQRAEVMKVSIYEYDEERELKIIRADEREIGREEIREKLVESEKKREESEKKREEAEKKREESEKKREESEKKREEAEKKREESEKKREELEKKSEEAYKSVVLLHKEMGLTQEDAIRHLVNHCFLEQVEAETIVGQNW